MPSAIDITKPVYGNPTTQSVRDNFEHAYDEITTLQSDILNRVRKDGDTMTGFLTLNADPTLALHAANRSWVINQIRSTANAIIYVGDYDAAQDKVLTSGQSTIVVGQPLPAAAPINSQMYFTVKVGSATSIGHQPPGGVPVGSWLLSNGTNWNIYQPSAAGVIAQTVPVNPAIVGLPGGDVYAALSSVPSLYLPLVGGTVSGNLSLALAPTLPGHATNKAYVDAHTFTPPTDPIVHSLTANTTDHTIKALYGTESGLKRWCIDLGNGNPNDDFVITRYNDSGTPLDGPGFNVFTINRATGNTYLAHSLYLNPPVNEAAYIIGRNNAPTDPNNDFLWIQSRVATSSQIKLLGPTYTGAQNQIQLVPFSADGSTYAAYNFSQAGASFPGQIYFNETGAGGAGNNGLQMPRGGHIYQAGDGGLVLERNYGNRIVLAVDGSMHYQGNNNYTDFFSVSATSCIINEPLSVASYVASTSWICQAQNGLQLYGSSSEIDLTYFGTAVYHYATTAYNIGWILDGTLYYSFRWSDKSIVAGSGYMFAWAFNVLSDESLKNDIQPEINIGLKEIVGIEPITYYQDAKSVPSRKPITITKTPNDPSPEDELKYKQMNDHAKTLEWKPQQQFGFSAQQVQTVFPQAVSKFEQDEDDSTLCVGVMPLLAALVNAVKELSNEVNTIKRRGKL